jgi:hypothetical protein
MRGSRRNTVSQIVLPAAPLLPKIEVHLFFFAPNHLPTTTPLRGLLLALRREHTHHGTEAGQAAISPVVLANAKALRTPLRAYHI